MATADPTGTSGEGKDDEEDSDDEDEFPHHHHLWTTGNNGYGKVRGDYEPLSFPPRTTSWRRFSVVAWSCLWTEMVRSEQSGKGFGVDDPPQHLVKL